MWFQQPDAFTLVWFRLECDPDPLLKWFERLDLYPSQMRCGGHLHLVFSDSYPIRKKHKKWPGVNSPIDSKDNHLSPPTGEPNVNPSNWIISQMHKRSDTKSETPQCCLIMKQIETLRRYQLFTDKSCSCTIESDETNPHVWPHTMIVWFCETVRGGKSTKIFYSSKSTITLKELYLSTSTSLKIYSSKSKK